MSPRFCTFRALYGTPTREVLRTHCGTGHLLLVEGDCDFLLLEALAARREGCPPAVFVAGV